MKKILASIGAIALCFFAATAQSQIINFDEIEALDYVNDYYNGGTSSLGGVGSDYGVSFQSGDWVVLGLYGQTSQPNFAYSLSGSGGVNFQNGITDKLNFSYGTYAETILSIYEGADGAGTQLATFFLPVNNPLVFDFVSLSFSGVAHSVKISTGRAQFGWDDITFGSGTEASAAPEPSAWAMMMIGFGVVGLAIRRRVAASHLPVDMIGVRAPRSA